MGKKCIFEVDMDTGEMVLLTPIYAEPKDKPLALLEYPAEPSNALGRGKPFIRHGISEPHGSLLRFRYKHRLYYGQILDRDLVFNGKRFDAPSPAVNSTAQIQEDGWRKIEVQRPSTKEWIPIDRLRQEARMACLAKRAAEIAARNGGTTISPANVLPI